MGTWGYKPLENDTATDFLSKYNDTKEIALLEYALDSVNILSVEQYLEAPEAEEAIAAVQIIRNSLGKIKIDDKDSLIDKANQALRRILKDSELKELWFESDEYLEWTKSVESLIS